jgi:integrase
MGFTVYFSNPETTTAAGFGKVARLPCILDSRPGYHRLASRYLIDRGLGIWDPVSHGRRSRPAPTKQTILNYAHWLANFLEWADVRDVDVFTCEYAAHVHGRYQGEMLQGTWSRDGTPLSPQTINLRVTQACDFLSWLADKGLRTSFEVPVVTRTIKTGGATSSVSHEGFQVAARKGKVRKNKRRLRMPTDDQLHAWLKRVYEHCGSTKGLMCETVLLTAMRREEVACLRTDTLPENPKDWHLSNEDAPRHEQRVLVDIKFGTKGPSYGVDHGDKVGPGRSIWIPLDLAERLHTYRESVRPRALRHFVGAAKNLSEKRKRIGESAHLFLDEKSGQRLTSRALYNAWTSVDLPFEGWSPHLGRDWWACSILWRELKKHEHIASLEPGVSAALLESSAMSIIRLQIQPQLGHAHDSTTMIYLQWVADLVGVNLSIDYERELPGR